MKTCRAVIVSVVLCSQPILGMASGSTQPSGGGFPIQSPASPATQPTHSSPTRHEGISPTHPSNYEHTQPQFGQTPHQNAPVDRYYEAGKVIFTGRYKPIGKIDYCLNLDNESVKLKAHTLSRFNKKSKALLSERLVDCTLPSVKVSTYMEPKHFDLVLHYLNVRYQLQLQ